MALHEENTHDVGAAIVGQPEDPNVGKWKEFLTRPENLATALVLMAGVTSPKARGQTDLNKVLTSGVGALGFRGGLESGVEAQRAGLREEQRTVEVQDADIAAQQAATAVTQGQLGVAQGRLATEQQAVTQAGQARPLPQSTIALQSAQAAALGRKEQPTDFPTLLKSNLDNALALSPTGTIDQAAVTLMTLQQMEDIRLQGAGILTRGIDPETGEFVLGIDDAKIKASPELLAEFGHLLPEPTEPTDLDDTVDPERVEDVQNPLRVSGRFAKNTHLARVETARILRKQGGFEGVGTAEILDTLAEIRAQASDEKQLRAMSVQELQEMLTVYARVLAKSEVNLIRQIILEKAKIITPRGERITTRRSFQ